MLASVLFLIVLVLIIWQPRGLQIGTTAILGALAALLLQVVNFTDIISVVDIVWDATLAFIGIILLSMVLDEIGFFEWAALKIVNWSHGDGRLLFIYIILLGALVAAFFANDGAALILTPILLAKMKHLNMDGKTVFALLLSGGFIGDAASSPLVISNLTNIVTAGYFDIGFFDYLQNMFLPNLAAIVASLLVLWLYFGRDIPRQIDISALKKPEDAIRHPLMFKLSWFFLALLMAGYFLGDWLDLPVSVFALGGALIFLAVASHFKAAKAYLTLKTAPWQVVWFSIGLYVVVFGLKNAGLTDIVASWISHLQAMGPWQANIGTGFIAAALSAVMNNMPTVMIMDIAIDQVGAPSLAYANILGCNLGPKITPIGSLATLLWLHVLAKKGVKITWLEYMKVGIVITPPVLLVALLFV